MKELYGIKGNVIYTKIFGKYEVINNGIIVVEDERVKGVYNELPLKYKCINIKDYGDKLIIPGFIDLHLHAPQFPNMGLGLDKELMPWLNKYTFPEEAKYNDLQYAENVYKKLIKKIWSVGTTRCCIFNTIHKESTKLLLDLFNKSGLGAYIGKVNMDRESPDELIEDTNKSILETIELVMEYKDKYKLVKPIITPRFVPTCSFELLKKLGEIADKYDIPVQSHLCENLGEIELVKKLHPECRNYAEVYDKANLLRENKSIMAHCVLVNETEIDLLRDKGVFVAHCPTSNLNLSSGIAPIRRLIERKVNVGLASDISGGHTLSMREVITSSAQVSNLRWINSSKVEEKLTTAELFYLATKGGGKFFGKVGSFEEDYEFDALVIDDSNLLIENNLSIEERLQKFLYIGNCNNIIERYVSGKLINEPIL
ncbi:MAG: guanine deaminase [Clostridium sp.]|nr:guanine deaminase [Clostridium sp.]